MKPMTTSGKRSPVSVWEIMAKVFSGDYRYLNIDIIAADIGEARRKFMSENPDIAQLYNSEFIVPVPNFEKTKIYREKVEREHQERKERLRLDKIEKKHKADWWASEGQWRYSP